MLKYSLRQSAALILVTIMLCALLTLSGCHAAKEGTKRKHHDTAMSTTADSLLSRLADMQVPQWQRLRVPLSLRVTSPASLGINATVTMVRDSSFTLSLRFLGMEVGVAQVTPDSVIALDKYHRQYFAESLTAFLGHSDITLANLQDALLGRVFLLGKSQLDASNVSQLSATYFTEDTPEGTESSVGLWMVSPSAKSSVAATDVSYGFICDALPTLQQAMIQADHHQPVIILYDQPIITPYGPMAKGLDIRATTSDDLLIEAALDWNFSKAEWNEKVSTRHIAVPSGYKRLHAADLLKAFTRIK